MEGMPRQSEAVQGELFDVDDEKISRGYRGSVASKVAGITYRQLDYWAHKQILEPSITPSHGSGSRRLYSFKDVLILTVSKKLLDTGVNLQNVTSAIAFLRTKPAVELGHMTIICDGQQVRECTSSKELLDIVQGGTAVFAVSVGPLWHQVRNALADEPSVDLTDVTVHQSVGSPIDDLAAERMRRKLQLQHRQRQRDAEQTADV